MNPDSPFDDPVPMDQDDINNVERLPMKTIEEAIEELTTAFATGINSLATGDFVREGVLREAVSSLIWELYKQMPDQRYALADVLEDFDNHVRNAMRQDAETAKPTS